MPDDVLVDATLGGSRPLPRHPMSPGTWARCSPVRLREAEASLLVRHNRYGEIRRPADDASRAGAHHRTMIDGRP